jgi:hypothetical protein
MKLRTLIVALTLFLLVPPMACGEGQADASEDLEKAEMTASQTRYSFETELLFNVEADLAAPEEIGPVPEGNRMNFYSKGGKFEGPKLRGKVRPVGGDWVVIRPDGVGQLDVRITLETDDGALIYAQYYGLIDFPGETKRAVAEGKDAPEKFKLLLSPIFRTSSDKYAWLNSVLAVGVGMTGENRVTYSIYRIK